MPNNDPGKGALFPNKYKSDGDSKPTFTGHLFAHRDLKRGERIELAAWPHKTGGGMSLKSQDPKVPSAEAKPRIPSGGGAALDGDDIPFSPMRD